MRNQLSFIRETLYHLKRDYGYTLDIYQYSEYSVDPRTGQRTVTRKIVRLKRAIVLPTVMARKFSMEVANRPFDYGGNFDVSQRMAILDKNDVVKDFKVNIDDQVIFENRRYQVKKTDSLPFGLILTLVETVGALTNTVLPCVVENSLQMVNFASRLD